MSCVVENSPNFKISVYAELKPQLATAQVYLKVLRNNYKRKLTLNIRRTSLELKWSKKHVHRLDFEDVRFVPTTVHSMQWVSQDELHFRMQVYDRLATNGHLIFDHEKPRDLLEPFQGDKVSISCMKCGNSIIREQRFKRVLPLPSDNWYEMADSLFCCKHKHTSTPEKHKNGNNNSSKAHPQPKESSQTQPENGSLSLEPKEKDCLVGETHFILHSASVLQQNIKQDVKSGSLKCSRCHHVIGQSTHAKNGEVKLKSVKLFTFSVAIDTAGAHEEGQANGIVKALSSGISLENQLADLLVSHNKKYSSFRMVIESKANRSVQPFLLVWLLDSKCYQYVGETAEDEGEGQQHCKVTSHQIVKLMYQDCLRENNASITESWSKDLTVHSIDLPEHTCLQMLDLLIESTHQLPQSMANQDIDGQKFHVGFLRKAECKPEFDKAEAAASRTD